MTLTLRSAVSTFGAGAQKKLANLGAAGEPEDQLRAPLEHLMLDLAELCGVRVYEFQPTHMNIPRESPCFGGFDPGAGLKDCDLGLLLDVDVPWLPRFTRENPATWWAHVDVDPLKQDFPMWGFATDLRLQADAGTVLRQLAAMVRQQADEAFHARVSERIAGSHRSSLRSCSPRASSSR